MNVLLCEDIETLGWYGDIVDVNEGYARNYLLPQRLATVPSEAKIKAMAEEKARRAEQRQVVIDNLLFLEFIDKIIFVTNMFQTMKNMDP